MGPKRKGSQILYLAEKEGEQFMKEDEWSHIYKTQQGLLERNRSKTEMKHSMASDGQGHCLLLLKEQKSLTADNSKAPEGFAGP